MLPTSLTLLDRLRHRPTEADWRRFHDLYQPLIRRWLARVPGLHDEAGDLSRRWDGGDWFDLEIIAAGPVVRVLVNGAEAARADPR